MKDDRSMEKDIIQILAKELDVPESAVLPEAHILDHLAADSLDTVFLILTLEEKFQIEIPDSEAASIQTVKDMFALVRAKYSPHHCRVKGVGPNNGNMAGPDNRWAWYGLSDNHVKSWPL